MSQLTFAIRKFISNRSCWQLVVIRCWLLAFCLETHLLIKSYKWNNKKSNVSWHEIQKKKKKTVLRKSEKELQVSWGRAPDCVSGVLVCWREEGVLAAVPSGTDGWLSSAAKPVCRGCDRRVNERRPQRRPLSRNYYPPQTPFQFLQIPEELDSWILPRAPSPRKPPL